MKIVFDTQHIERSGMHVYMQLQWSRRTHIIYATIAAEDNYREAFAKYAATQRLHG